VKRLPDIILIAILIVYTGVTFAISRVTPFNKGPDEETNLAYVEFIAEKGRLPLTYTEREQVGKDSNWPPLYHMLLAGLSNGLGIELAGPPQIKIFWDSFRYRAIDAGAEWYYLRTEDQTWPYYGRILVLHLGRWLSILFGMITLILVYYVVLALVPGRRKRLGRQRRPWRALRPRPLRRASPGREPAPRHPGREPLDHARE